MTKETLAGGVALITGASRGIGAAIYGLFGESGAAVVGTATTKEGAAAIDKSAAESGFRGAGVVYDAADGEAAKKLHLAAAEKFGAPDIVVCNAGITNDGLLMRMKDDDWRRVMETNLTGAFYLARASVAAMVKNRRGRLIGISSVVAHLGNAGQANYCASKAGMEGMFRAVAREVAPRGITANVIAPGFVDTQMTAKLPEKVRAHFLQSIPLGRMATAQEIAAAALFLASPAAAYITGQTLHINGGLTMG